MMNNIDEMKSDLDVLKSARDMVLPIVMKYGFNASSIPAYWIKEVEQMIQDYDPFKNVEAFINQLEYVDTTITDGYLVKLVGDGKSIHFQNIHLQGIHEYVKHLQEENVRLKVAKAEAVAENKPIDPDRYNIALKLGRAMIEDSRNNREFESGRNDVGRSYYRSTDLAVITKRLGLVKDLTGVANVDWVTIKISVELLLEECKGVRMMTEDGKPFFIVSKDYEGTLCYEVLLKAYIETSQANITDCAVKAAMLYNCGKMSNFDISILPVDLPEDFSFTDALAFLDALVEFKDYTRTLREDWQHFRWKARVWKDLQDYKKGTLNFLQT